MAKIIKTKSVAQTYLHKLKMLDYQITVKVCEIKELNEIISSLGSSAADVRVQTSGTSDKTADNAIKLADLQHEAVMKCNEWARRKIDASKLINQMDDQRYQCVLALYYLQNKTFYEVAEKMDLSYQWVCALHENALKEFENVMIKNGLCGEDSDEHISRVTY